MPSLEKAKKRGIVIIRSRCTYRPIIILKLQKNSRKLLKSRNLEKLRARFVIIDSTQLMFMLLDDEKFHPSYDIGIWINTEFFAQALEQFFELAWKDLKPVK